MSGKILWPFGAADTVALSATGAQALTITNNLTIVDGVTTVATGNRTVTCAADATLPAGARIVMKLKTTGTETTAFSTGMIGTTITGVAGKTKTQEFVYDGTNFVASSAPVQID